MREIRPREGTELATQQREIDAERTKVLENPNEEGSEMGGDPEEHEGTGEDDEEPNEEGVEAED